MERGSGILWNDDKWQVNNIKKVYIESIKLIVQGNSFYSTFVKNMSIIDIVPSKHSL